MEYCRVSDGYWFYSFRLCRCPFVTVIQSLYYAFVDVYRYRLEIKFETVTSSMASRILRQVRLSLGTDWAQLPALPKQYGSWWNGHVWPGSGAC